MHVLSEFHGYADIPEPFQSACIQNKEPPKSGSPNASVDLMLFFAFCLILMEL